MNNLDHTFLVLVACDHLQLALIILCPLSDRQLQNLNRSLIQESVIKVKKKWAWKFTCSVSNLTSA